MSNADLLSQHGPHATPVHLAGQFSAIMQRKVHQSLSMLQNTCTAIYHFHFVCNDWWSNIRIHTYIQIGCLPAHWHVPYDNFAPCNMFAPFNRFYTRLCLRPMKQKKPRCRRHCISFAVCVFIVHAYLSSSIMHCIRNVHIPYEKYHFMRAGIHPLLHAACQSLFQRVSKLDSWFFACPSFFAVPGSVNMLHAHACFFISFDSYRCVHNY